MLKSGDAYPGDVVGRFLAAAEDGDTQGVLGNFETDGYLREPIGPHLTHRGDRELGSYFAECFDGGGIRLEHRVLTDDGTRSALEYNCVCWGRHELPPQAGIGVFERSPGGLLQAVRIYDDIEPPGGHPS